MSIPGDVVVGQPALLVIDMQRDFVEANGACPTPGAADIVERLAALVSVARAAPIPVLFTQEAHRPGRVDAGRELDSGTGVGYHGGPGPLPEHCVEGSSGIEIVDRLVPLPQDLVIRKRRYSCFFGTELDLLLHARGVSTLLIAGVCSNACVLWTVGDAFQLDYHVRVIGDCIAGTAPAEHEAALTIMRALTGRPPVTFEQVAEALGAHTFVSSPR